MGGLETLNALREEHVADQDREEKESRNESKAGLHFGAFISTLNQFRERKGPNWLGVSCGHSLNIVIPGHRHEASVSWTNVLDLSAASEKSRWNDRCHTSRCLHPLCSLLSRLVMWKWSCAASDEIAQTQPDNNSRAKKASKHLEQPVSSALMSPSDKGCG